MDADAIGPAKGFSPRRGAAVRAAVTAAGFLLALRTFTALAVDAWPLAGAPAGADSMSPKALIATSNPDDVLGAALLWCGIALSGWLATGALLTALSLVPGALGRLGAAAAERVTPVVLRRVLVLGVGVGLGTLSLPSGATASPRPPVSSVALVTSVTLVSAVSSGTATVSADTTGCPPPMMATPPPGPVTEQRPTPGWRATRPVPSHDPGPGSVLAPAPRPLAAVLDAVTVRRGDTLWGIAAAHLGPGASVGAIAREWPRWYAANRTVIGDDPDLIRPGAQLRPPPDGSPT
ncbi:MAG: LysM peptidoglycan-binding domain-containing protein [Terracoccus sp.]